MFKILKFAPIKSEIIKKCLVKTDSKFIHSTSATLTKKESKYSNYKAGNEPILGFAPGSVERQKLKAQLDSMVDPAKRQGKSDNCIYDVPIVIGDREIRTNNVMYQPFPFDHKTKLAKFYHADKNLINEAIVNSLEARAAWDNTSFDFRSEILLKTADALADPKRYEMLAATMLGQGKTIYQAEIDSTCELIDFIRCNVQFLYETLKYKPLDDGTHTINNISLRGREGFLAAIAPFNFTAIGGNLCTAPALMGNVVIWKPSDTAVYSAYVFYKLLRENGLPPGVINFVPG
jgi:1-pyrroline-5-carboxylate dehydrogenase